MLVDLVQTTTRDGVRLEGAWQPRPASGGALGVDAFILVHGTGGSFYSSTLIDALTELFLSAGVGALRINTRGHDLMSNASTTRGGRRLGAAYEIVDDCRHDLAAWVGWLKDKGASRIGLLGHSLGAVKCLYVQAHDPDPAVVGVVAVSPPRLSYSWFLAGERASELRDTHQRAAALVSAGEPETLLEVRLPLPMVITAGGYVEKYGPDERYNYLRFLDRIKCPVLLTLGEVECAGNIAFRDAAQAVAQAAPTVRIEMVPGADHFYTNAREELLRRVEAWIRTAMKR